MKWLVPFCLALIVASNTVLFAAFYQYLYFNESMPTGSQISHSNAGSAIWFLMHLGLSHEQLLSYAFWFSTVLAALCLVLSVNARVNKGQYKLFPALSLTSLTIAVVSVVTYINTGLYHHL